jgi:hypothetical protein
MTASRWRGTRGIESYLSVAKGESTVALDLKTVETYSTTVEGRAGAASRLLAVFAVRGSACSHSGPFPCIQSAPGSRFSRTTVKMTDGAKTAGLKLDGPHSALLIKGSSDEPGDLARIYQKLAEAEIPVGDPAESLTSSEAMASVSTWTTRIAKRRRRKQSPPCLSTLSREFIVVLLSSPLERPFLSGVVDQHKAVLILPIC